MNEFFVLTRIVNDSDPDWDLNATIVGTWEQINAVVDLSRGTPYGWRLLRGKKAHRFLKCAAKHEIRYQRDHAARKATGGPN
jgi:hypothetical protein